MVASEAPGKVQRRIGSMIFEVFADEKYVVERMNSTAIHRIAGTQSLNDDRGTVAPFRFSTPSGAWGERSACSICASGVNSISGLEYCCAIESGRQALAIAAACLIVVGWRRSIKPAGSRIP
jgi:hypothetical protein